MIAFFHSPSSIVDLDHLDSFQPYVWPVSHAPPEQLHPDRIAAANLERIVLVRLHHVLPISTVQSPYSPRNIAAPTLPSRMFSVCAGFSGQRFQGAPPRRHRLLV